MRRVIIVGGGFAGLAAARELRRYNRGFDVILIDRRKTTCFWPLVPDCIGRPAVTPELLEQSLAVLSGMYGFAFLQEEVTGFDFQQHRVIARELSLSYDFLLLTCGVRPNYYGNDAARAHAFSADNPEQLRQLGCELKQAAVRTVVVAGGGYTGIECATNSWRVSRHSGQPAAIIVVERAAEILSGLPVAFRNYVAGQLRHMGIGVRTAQTVTAVTSDTVTLSEGSTYESARLIWAAGVRAPACVAQLRSSGGGQQRVRVNEYLQFGRNRFAAGDCAAYFSAGRPLRLSVQHALSQGAVAARNIAAAAAGNPLRRYQPLDLGYIVPLANNQSCGLALGMPVRGRAATVLHYMMCAYRQRGLARQLKTVAAALT